jgi:hypothetical protein
MQLDGVQHGDYTISVDSQTLWVWSNDKHGFIQLFTLKGDHGADGKNGSDGENGITPVIGENGTWWIGKTDTGVQAEGKDGAPGEQGLQGEQGPQGNGFYVMPEDEIENLIQCLNDYQVINGGTVNRDNLVEVLLGEAPNTGAEISQEMAYGLYAYFGGTDYNYYLIDGYLFGNIICEYEGEPATYATSYEICKIKGEDGKNPFTEEEVETLNALPEALNSTQSCITALETRLAALEQALQNIDLSGLAIAYPITKEE